MANFNTKDYAALKTSFGDIGEIRDSKNVIWRAAYSSIDLYPYIGTGQLAPAPTLTISGGRYCFGDSVNLFHTQDGGYCMSYLPANYYTDPDKLLTIFDSNNYSQRHPTTKENTTGLFDYSLSYSSSIDTSSRLINKGDVALSTSSPFVARLAKSATSLAQPKVKVKSGYPEIFLNSSSVRNLKIQLKNRTQGGYTLTVIPDGLDTNTSDYYPIFIRYYQKYSHAIMDRTVIVEDSKTTSIDLTDTELSSGYPIKILRLIADTGDLYTEADSFTSIGTHYYRVLWQVQNSMSSFRNFKLTSSNTIVSTNNGIANSCSYAFIFFKMPDINKFKGIRLHINQSSEKNYDYGMLSGLDKPLKPTFDNDPTNVMKTLKGFIGDTTEDYAISDTNTHFITIKYRKDGSANVGNDILQISNIKYIELFDFDLSSDISTGTATLTINNHTNKDAIVTLNCFALN